MEAVRSGISNLKRHVNNMKKFGLPTIVAINHFVADTVNEIKILQEECNKINVEAVPCEHWSKGGEGAINLAKKVVDLVEQKNSFKFLYDNKSPLIDKIKTIQGEIDKMIDQGSISMEAYTRLEDRIAKNSPTLGIENEWEKFSESLLAENDELKEHEHQLSIDLAKTKKELERQTAYGHDKESISVVMEMLSVLKFHPSAVSG